MDRTPARSLIRLGVDLGRMIDADRMAPGELNCGQRRRSVPDWRMILMGAGRNLLRVLKTELGILKK